VPTFYKLLGITLLVVTANNFVWFALTFWGYLTTRSVIVTSVIAGVYLVLTAVLGLWFGSIVDHHRKKHALLGSSVASLACFAAALTLFHATPEESFTSAASVRLWIFIVVQLAGTLAGMIYNIAIPTLVAFVVPVEHRDRANGMFGTVTGVAFGVTSVVSGVSLAFGGMGFVLAAAIIATLFAIVLLAMVPVDDGRPAAASAPAAPRARMDVPGTLRAVRSVPGLFALIFFTTFNNFIGGVFFALMDAYGLTLVSVEVWGFLWGFLSLSFILGGLYISTYGLGRNPLTTLFRNNVIAWTVCVFFTVQPSIALLAAGVFIWMFLVPFTEAIEQTILQAVVPKERLGRVIGFAHAVEQAASPITAFLIGPIAQLIFIPFMTTGAGAETIGHWYGTGPGRGMALVFSTAGAVGLVVTLAAMRSASYARLAERYRQERAVQA
jgi:DHA3 family multidrug efflux protein-like MFS transporter